MDHTFMFYALSLKTLFRLWPIIWHYINKFW